MFSLNDFSLKNTLLSNDNRVFWFFGLTYRPVFILISEQGEPAHHIVYAFFN